MANFEYYLDMYTRQREGRYQQAMELAYRDLMLEYKNELMARQALQEQIQLQQELQSKLKLQFVKAFGKKDGGSLTAYQASQSQLGWEKLSFESAKAISKAYTETPKEINKQYELDSSTIETIAQTLRRLNKTTMPIKGLESALEEAGVLNKISSLTEKQRQEFSSNYIPQLVTILNKNEINDYGGLSGAAEKLSVAFGLGPYKSKNVLDKTKRLEIDEAMKTKVNLLQVPAGLQKTATTAGITEDQLKAAIASAIPEISTIPETSTIPVKTDDIPLPTGDLLRARAAEYYAPFASEQFQQKVAAAKEPAPVVEPVKPEVSKQQINQDALAGLPEYAGKMFRAAGAVEKIIDLDEETFKPSTAQQTAALLIPDIKEGRSNYETAVQQIEKKFDKPEEIEQALAVLGVHMLREFRKQQQITPKLEDIASQPSRNKQ